jgi:hypothetical protein
MKAIVNVKKGSTYSRYNGMSFEVDEILSNVLCLNINGVKTDFSFNELLIKDEKGIIRSAKHYFKKLENEG